MTSLNQSTALASPYSVAPRPFRLGDWYLIELAAFFVLLAIGLLDRISPPEFSLVLLYLLPIGMVAWLGSKWGQWRMVLAGVWIWTLLHSASQQDLDRELFVWLVAEKAALFGFAVLLISRLRQAMKEQRKLSQTVVERLRVVEQLAAGVAHEVRNPLGTILSGVEYLSRQPRSDVEHQLVEDMHSAVVRAEVIVHDLNDFSAPLRLNIIPLDVAVVVRLAAKEARTKADANDISIVVQTGPAMMVHADQTRIIQVLVNLLRNAIDVSPRGGAVCISARKLGRRVSIDVEDSGPGIPPEQLSKVFEPFFTTKAPGAGTGLGLAVSRRIVEDHHGELILTNRAGKGLCASLILNLKDLA